LKALFLPWLSQLYDSRPGICNIFVHKPIEAAQLSIDNAGALRDEDHAIIKQKTTGMTIDKETVEKVAHLARLELTETEVQDAMKDMSKILDFMAKLNEVDTTGVEPLVYMTTGANVLREDVVKQQITHEEALENAPKHDEDFFLVAKVIEK